MLAPAISLLGGCAVVAGCSMIVASVANPLQHRRGQLGIVAVEGGELADHATANRVRGAEARHKFRPA
jgi:hypothetical protein